MEELINIMSEIRDQLIVLNSKIDDLSGDRYINLDDLFKSIESIKGTTGYDLTDIHSSLSDIETRLSSIDINTSLLG